MANFALYRQADDIRNFQVIDNDGTQSFDTINKTQSYGVATGIQPKFRFNLDSAQNFNFVALVGMNAWPTLELILKDGATTTRTETITGATFKAESERFDLFNALFLFADTDADYVNINTTVESPTSLGFAIAGELAFQPTTNHTLGSVDNSSAPFKEVKTGGRRYIHHEALHRQDDLKTDFLTEAEIKTLFWAKRKISDAPFLYSRDTDSTHPDDWYIAQFCGGHTGHTGTRRNESMIIKELTECR